MNLAGLVDPRVLQQQGAYAKAFSRAEPFPHVVIDDFLAENFCAEIIDQFPAFDVRTAINEDGEVGGKSTREKVRELGEAYLRLDDLIRSPEFTGLVGRITAIDALEYDPWYFGGGTHENRHGQDLDPHIDFNYHPITSQHRRLNLIIYLNDEWQEEWGGLLQLHRDPRLDPGEDRIVTISPARNRCVIFETSERSWHGFERIDLPEDKRHLSRRSFAVYYYTRHRDVAETAEEHSTVYIERHLPAHYTAGLELEERHIQELKSLLNRRDRHLQRLYKEIQRLYARLNRVPGRRFAKRLRSWLSRLF